METSKSTFYLPSQIKTGMSSTTRDPEVKRLGDPDWDFSGPRSLTGPPVTCAIQLAADRMNDTKGVTAITGSSNVGLETVALVRIKHFDVLHEIEPKFEAKVEVDGRAVVAESEAPLPRHKRVTSAYNSDELDLSVDDVDAERKRLSEEISQIKHHLSVLSGQSPCESGHLVDTIEAQEKFKHVTSRGVQRVRGDRHASESSPASSSVRHHPGR